MFEEMKITGSFRISFNKVFKKMPKKLQKDEYNIETMIAYLKMGGERLASKSIEVLKAIDKLETARRKRKLRDEALLRTACARKIQQKVDIGNNELDIQE